MALSLKCGRFIPALDLYNGIYAEALPERGTFFRFQVYERVGISLVDVYETVGKSFHSVIRS